MSETLGKDDQVGWDSLLMQALQIAIKLPKRLEWLCPAYSINLQTAIPGSHERSARSRASGACIRFRPA